jgi:hypothetical protein
MVFIPKIKQIFEIRHTLLKFEQNPNTKWKILKLQLHPSPTKTSLFAGA